MHVLLITDVLVVESIRGYVLFTMGRSQQRDEVALELVAEIGDVFARVLADDLHLANVRLGLDMAFEAVGIATLFLADFAPPPQALEAL